jgi:hypothetical protein
MRQLVGVFGERAASCGQSMSMPRPPKQDFAELRLRRAQSSRRGVSASTYGEQVRKTGLAGLNELRRLPRTRTSSGVRFDASEACPCAGPWTAPSHCWYSRQSGGTRGRRDPGRSKRVGSAHNWGSDGRCFNSPKAPFAFCPHCCYTNVQMKKTGGRI